MTFRREETNAKAISHTAANAAHLQGLPLWRPAAAAAAAAASAAAAAVTNYTTPTPKAFNFRLSPSNADVLHSLRLGFVATANNHVLDYGQPGLKETNQVSKLGVNCTPSGLQ
jgi:poly-gamma-glutamate capsule biosynthesis protein CapA/YwtB (metallophosphatase superfamily)